MVRSYRGVPAVHSLSAAQRIGLCCLGPAMIALSFPRLGWSFLAPVALVPILWGTAGVCVTRGALLGWAGGIVGYTVACGWILQAVRVFQDVSAWRAIPPFVLSQIYHGGQFALFAGVATWLRNGRGWTPIAATASCWGLLEWGYPKLARWSLGDVTIDWPYIPQIADLAGAAGIGFLVAATSIVLFNAVFGGDVSRRMRWTPVAILVACYGCAALYGVLRIRHFDARESSKQIEVGIVQEALPVGDADPQRASARGWQAYAARSAGPDLDGVELLVWPETIIREYLRHGSHYASEIAQLAASLNTTIVLGALDLPEVRVGEFSAAYAIGADGQIQRAHKMYLLPFGEYTPGSEWFPWLSSWRTTGAFLPGTEHPILNAAGMHIASSICFEAVFPGFNNDQLMQGADLLVNLSNDGWFGDSNLPYMHLQAARWRALEARRWMVRASNSGISAILSPTGTVVASMPYGRADALRARVFAETELTPFVRWGNWFLWVQLTLFGLGCVIRLRPHERV